MGLARAHLVTIVTTALVAGLLSAAPVSARSDPAGDSRRGGSHYPASIDTKVPPGGSSTITAPTIPKDTKTLQVKLEADADATQAEVDAFDSMAQVMGKMTKGNKLLTCVMVYNDLITSPPLEEGEGTEADFQLDPQVIATAVLLACVQVADLLSTTSSDGTAEPGTTPLASPRAKMRPCVQDKPGVSASAEQGDDGLWTLTVDGVIEKTPNKLKVGCRTKSGTTVLTVRAAKKGVPLRKVMGKKPMLSLASPADAESSAPTTVTFSLP